MNLLDQPLISESIKKTHRRQLEAKANQYLKANRSRRGIRKKHKRKIPKMTYSVYIKSKYWKKRKNDYFGAFGKKCALCQVKYGVTLHHAQYDSNLFGKEPNSHLVALCPKHHHEFHENHKLAENMKPETDLYIKTAKSFIDSNLDDLSWI